MDKPITLHIPTEILQRAETLAGKTNRTRDDVLLAWLDQGAGSLPVAALSDEEVLRLCDLQMDAALNEELSALQFLNREGRLDEAGRLRLDELMGVYRRGLLQKAEALKVAVERQLRPPLR